MKKIVYIVATLLAAAMILTACGSVQTGNRVVVGQDVQTFTYCHINLGGEKIVEGYITQWRDYDNSDVVQLLVDGKYYLTHYTNVVMIADPRQGNMTYSNSGVYGVDE